MSPLRALAPQKPMSRLILIVVVAAALGAATSGVITGVIIRHSINASSRTQRDKLFTAQVNGCKRANIKQATANKNLLDEWRFNSFFAEALTKPQPNQTAVQRKLTPIFRRRLRDLINTLAWAPLNHKCGSDPTGVQLPVFFSVRKPTKADLPSPSHKHSSLSPR